MSMDWGLITVILAVAFLVGHLALDFRSLALRLQWPHNNTSGYSPVLASTACERCHARKRGRKELRHEAVWTLAAVTALTGHIILDFVI